MQVSRKRLALFASVIVSFVFVVGAVGPAFAQFLRGSSPYATSFTVAQSLQNPVVLGYSSGLLFLTQSSAASGTYTVTLDTLNTATSALTSLSSYTGSGVVIEFLVSDGAGNVYYDVASASGEQVEEQAHTSSGFSGATMLYQDSICPEGIINPPSPCPTSNTSGITGMASDPAGNVYLALDYPDGSAAILKISAADTTPTKVYSIPSGQITSIVFASGALCFTSSVTGSGTEQINSLDPRTGNVGVLLSASISQYAAGVDYLSASSSSGRDDGRVYYLYRVSRGPTTFAGAPSGWPQAELVVGGIPTGAAPGPRGPGLPGQLTGQIGSEFFTPPTSVAVFAPGQSMLWVNPSGDLLFVVAPYPSSGVSSGDYTIQRFTSGDSAFSQIVAFPFAANQDGNGLTFAMDGSGNVYCTTNVGTIMEIEFS